MRFAIEAPTYVASSVAQRSACDENAALRTHNADRNIPAIVTVVGASGTLGSHIVEALLDKGARVRAMVRATTNRTKLEAFGVTEFVVADLNDFRVAIAGFNNRTPSRGRGRARRCGG